MKCISFSLYGAHPKYGVGACKNAILAKRFFPDYKCVFWVKNDVPQDVVDYLKFAGAIIKPFDETLGIGGMFHRFLVNDLPDCDRYLIRDADSRINERDSIVVREWEKSGAPFHTARDHPHHRFAILGGIWGSVKGAVPNMLELIREYTGPLEGYDADQQFLRDKVWPIVKDKAFHHTLPHDATLQKFFPGGRRVPAPLSYRNPRFLCEVFDAHDRPRSYDWEKILMHVAPRELPNAPKPLFVRTHLGLGDAFIQNGMVRALCASHPTVVFPARHCNVPTVKQMFSDLVNLLIVPVKDDGQANELAALHKGKTLKMGMFADKWTDGKPGWDKLLYKQSGVPFEKRWEGFKIGHRSTNEHQFKFVDVDDKPVPGEFAILHEDVPRQYLIPKERRPDLPTVTIWKSDSLLDFMWMIENAKEIHCIDSSFACLVDSLPPTRAEKLVLHLYARPNAKPPTYKKPWIILTK